MHHPVFNASVPVPSQSEKHLNQPVSLQSALLLHERIVEPWKPVTSVILRIAMPDGQEEETEELMHSVTSAIVVGRVMTRQNEKSRRYFFMHIIFLSQSTVNFEDKGELFSPCILTFDGYQQITIIKLTSFLYVGLLLNRMLKTLYQFVDTGAALGIVMRSTRFLTLSAPTAVVSAVTLNATPLVTL